jgi:hypothetical protein
MDLGQALRFFSQLQGALQARLGAFLELIANRPMVLPNEIVGLVSGSVDQGESSLKILKERSVRQPFHFGKQILVQVFGLRSIATAVQQNEGFTQLDVLGLVHAELSHHHDAAKNKEGREDQLEPVSTCKRHAIRRSLIPGST